MPRLVHFELNVENIEKTVKFYQKVFRWKFEKWEGPIDYWFIITGDENEPGIDGGLGSQEENFPKVVNTIDVEDLDKVIKDIKSNGGKIIRPKHAVPDVGWLAYFEDPEGIVSGAMQSDPEAK